MARQSLLLHFSFNSFKREKGFICDKEYDNQTLVATSLFDPSMSNFVFIYEMKQELGFNSLKEQQVQTMCLCLLERTVI